MNILEFVNKFNLNWQPIEIIITPSDKPNKEFDKTQDFVSCPLPRTNDYRKKNISKEELKRRQDTYAFNHIAIHTSKHICVIDVDFEDDKEYSQESLDWVEEMKKVLPYKKSTTRKRGLHLFFIGNGNGFKGDRQPDTPYEDIEILTNQWSWESIDSEILNVRDSIPKMKIPSFKKCKEVTETIDIDIVKDAVDTAVESVTDPILNWIQNMSIQKVDKYQDWFETLVAIKKYGEQYKEAAHELSKKSSNYGKFEETWNAIKCGGNKTSLLDSIVNPSQDFYDIFGKNIVVNSFDGKKEVYCYDNKSKLWRRDDSLCLIKYNIGKILKKKYKKDLADETNEGIVKTKLGILTKSIDGNGWRSDVAQVLLQIVIGHQYENIKFDNIDYLYHFKNTTLDLRNLSFRERVKEDYCTMFACELVPRNDEKVKMWDKIITSIFLDSEVRKTYLDVIINSFSGRVLQKFVILNGKGSNGKSMLNNCFKYLHGDYYYKGACSDLCQPSKGGSNPSLANCNKKRFCVYTEPNEKESLQVSTLKDITGEDSINARKNFSNDTHTKMGGVKLLECNKRLKLAGDTGFSLQRRIIDLLYNSTFKSKDGITELDEEYHSIDNTDGYQNANPEYETTEWREEHCSDLFHYLYDFMKTENKNYSKMSDFTICESVKKRSQAYVLDNNDFLTLVNNYCEPSKDDYVFVKDIKQAMEEDADYYSLLSKYDKKQLTIQKLKKRLQEDAQLGSFFKDRIQINKKQVYNVLLHYKLKEVEKEVEEVKKECVLSDSEDDEDVDLDLIES